MSDRSRNRKDETRNHKKPWERTEETAKPGKRLAASRFPTAADAQKKREKRIMVVMIAAAVVMVLAAALVLLYNRWIRKPTLPPSQPAASDSPGESRGPLTGDPDPEATLSFGAVQPKVGGQRRSKDIYTVLIFGSDETSGLTDSMMVATYDVTNQKATVMSLPRDTLINSSARPSIAAKKLNAVYNVYGQGDSGIQALRNEVSELVGFMPDYYVQIDWALVGEMVDAIGGVWFDNPYFMNYYDPYQDLVIYQEQGYRLLSGTDAMQVVRWRHNDPGFPYNPGVSTATAVGDVERLEVQHSFLKAVLKQTLQIGNITRIGQLIDLFNSRVNSDLALEEMFWFAKEAVVGGLKVEDVEFCTMPFFGGSYGKESFVYPNQRDLLAIINSSLNPFVEEVTIRQLDLMGVNADGSLRSSTGRLAEPSLGFPPVTETEDPEESGDPDGEEELDEEGNPIHSENPGGEDEPGESGEPAASDPGAAETGTPAPAETMPAWLLPPGAAETEAPAETGGGSAPPPADGGGPDDGDWGDTPD